MGYSEHSFYTDVRLKCHLCIQLFPCADKQTNIILAEHIKAMTLRIATFAFIVCSMQQLYTKYCQVLHT